MRRGSPARLPPGQDLPGRGRLLCAGHSLHTSAMTSGLTLCHTPPCLYKYSHQVCCDCRSHQRGPLVLASATYAHTSGTFCALKAFPL
uniref:Uncharacterized protein n=1 Tax=Papilio xuthus TaxID=66420 RepID=I4DQH1_PAPXU|nr:unknown secreted protein [Papilio xuthus]